ncbi:hypothetical protein [Naasia sp. SYSU D00057]|uniref:hypothetical protein n=1 Tax=Naasia sp. SYSU D00057 TaxID=2817380 RepID=UPI001FF00579|nr:hypothetical protein [Naasia sp. SYSU D00057]
MSASSPSRGQDRPAPGGFPRAAPGCRRSAGPESGSWGGCGPYPRSAGHRAVLAGAAVGPVVGALIGLVGYPLAFAVVALAPVAATPLIPRPEDELDRL